MNEHGLIARYFAPVAGAGGLGLIDDAACVAPPAGHDLVVTVDAIVAGVHFFPDDPPDTIARKALRVNLSDLAAKGATPLGFVHVLALPAGGMPEAWLAAYASALGEDSRNYVCPLLGGDLVATPGPLTISITALGIVPSGKMVKRSGARAGDAICVTGTIGDAALGLKLRDVPAWSGRLDAADRAHLADRYLVPKPRNAVAAIVRDHATAAMDVSDGLAGDLEKLLGASGRGGLVDIADVPFSRAARRALRLESLHEHADSNWQLADAVLLEMALTGGDDYEILLCCAPSHVARMHDAMALAGVALTRIGTIGDRADGLRFCAPDGTSLIFARPSYSHL